MLYDLLIQTNMPMFKGEGATLGGTERQILTVAEKLASDGVNVGIIHSETDGTDKIVENVKHLNVYRHHLAKSKLRVYCNQFSYMHNIHKGYYDLYGPHVPMLSPIEINSSEKSYNWIHNWYNSDNLIPRVYNSEAVKKYTTKKNKDDTVIHYMIPKGIDVKPLEQREDYLYWMSAFGKGLKEAILLYINLYEKGLRKPFYISIPPQRLKKDVDIINIVLKDINKHGYPITFLGELDYDNAMKTLSKASCLFRPSSPQETFGLVYLEANSLGVPVITCSNDAGKEILIDKNNMFIEKTTEVEDILYWLSDIQDKKTSVDMSKFDPDFISHKWINLIEKN